MSRTSTPCLFFPYFDLNTEDTQIDLSKYPLSKWAAGNVEEVCEAFAKRLERAEQIMLETVDKGKDAIITCVQSFISWCETEYDNAVKTARGNEAIQGLKQADAVIESLKNGQEREKDLAWLQGKAECLDMLAKKLEESAE
jgi:hypothetical protein